MSPRGSQYPRALLTPGVRGGQHAPWSGTPAPRPSRRPAVRGSYPGLFARQLHCKASSPPGESGPRIWAGEAVFQMHVTMNFGGAGAVILSCPLWGTTLLASRVLFALTSFPCCLLKLMLVTHSPFQREVFLVRRGDERYIVNNFLPFLAPAPFPSVQDWAPATGLEYRVVIHLHRKGRETSNIFHWTSGSQSLPLLVC